MPAGGPVAHAEDPIFVNWDHKGRAFVIQTTDYPNNLHSGNLGNDKIIICEDTDKDGRADEMTVFAEGLSLPIGFEITRVGNGQHRYVNGLPAGLVAHIALADPARRRVCNNADFRALPASPHSWSLPPVHRRRRRRRNGVRRS